MHYGRSTLHELKILNQVLEEILIRIFAKCPRPLCSTNLQYATGVVLDSLLVRLCQSTAGQTLKGAELCKNYFERSLGSQPNCTMVYYSTVWHQYE